MSKEITKGVVKQGNKCPWISINVPAPFKMTFLVKRHKKFRKIRATYKVFWKKGKYTQIP